MSTSQSGAAEFSDLVARISALFGDIQSAWAARLARFQTAPEEAAALSRSLREAGETWQGLLGIACLSVIAVLAASYVMRRLAAGRSAAAAASTLLAGIVLAVVFGAVLPAGAGRDVAHLWTLATAVTLVLADLIYAVLSRHDDDPLMRRLGMQLAGAAAAGMCSVTLLATLRRLGAGTGLADAVSFVTSLSVTVLLCAGYVLERHAIERSLLRGPPPSHAARRLAGAWPWIAVALVLTTFAVLQISATLAGPLPGLPVLGTVLLILLTPHLDQLIARKIEAAEASIPVSKRAWYRTARVSFWLLVVCCLGMLWFTRLSVAMGFPRGLVVSRGLEIALSAMAAIYVWHVVDALTGHSLVRAGPHGDESEDHPATRLATLVPIIRIVLQVSIVAFAALSILIALGVNAWPLLAGLSVFGLAIGFGSQSLVKDIVSGIFFLLEDAFRIGEYIETSQAKGTVERISIRSVALRHPRGALATVPYGSIGKVVNFSRDWVIEKLAFRVAFDTDVNLVRKLFKTIGQELAADPELGPDLLEPFKSQGIFAVDEGALVIRAKFMARAGRQFLIRKAVLAAVHKAFRENGIVPVARLPQLSAPGS